MYAQLKTLNVDRLDLDEAVALSSFGASLEARYKDLGLEVPTWLSDNLKMLDREIESRVTDSLQKQLKSAESRLESLKPADQKRRELAQEIKQLRARLA